MKVAAVFATMNRSATALECLRRLAGDAQRPWRVFVTDNDSVDDTATAIREMNTRGLAVEVLEPKENLGNAGGVRLAMEKAFSEGADAVWILDDDSWPEPGAFAELIDSDGPDEGVRTSFVVEPATGRPSWPMQVYDGSRWNLRQNPSADSPWVQIRRSWLGALIPRKVRKRVGEVNGDLFLRGEDEDYPRRIEKEGFPVHLATRSILLHPAPGNIATLRIGRRTVILETGLGGLKLYYRIRNSLWILKRDDGLAAAAALALCQLALIVKAERPLGSAAKAWARAVRDGFGNRLGRASWVA